MAFTYGRKPARRFQGKYNGSWRYISAHSALPEVSKRISYSIQKATSESPKSDNVCAQGVFGFVYHTGPQSLYITVPGDTVPVKFGKHTVLSGIKHEEESPEIVIESKGVYEISYALSLSSETAVYTSFALQADGESMPGGVITRMVNQEERTYIGTVLAEINDDTMIRLIATAGSAVKVDLSASGVSASLVIKKIGC